MTATSHEHDGLRSSELPRGLDGTTTAPPDMPWAPAQLSTAPPSPASELEAAPRSSSRPVAISDAEEKLPTIPGYEIIGRLGKGGMGQVFKARPSGLGQVVALKMIRADRQEDLSMVRRFQREAKAGRRLDHPNIVAFYDAQQVDNVCFLTMEFVEGNDLAQLLAQTDDSLPIPLACEWIRQAALGLEHAHKRGMIHRDIKPANLLLTKDGNVKILDMGLVRLGPCPETGHSETDLTHSGVMMGTPAYMAPEQVFDARNVDGRADIYSLGCTLYELLIGRPPHRHQMKEPPPLDWARPEVSPILAAVVRRMMARMPEERYPAAADVVTALSPFCHRHVAGAGQRKTMPPAESDSPRKRPSRRLLLWLALAGALLVGTLGAIGFYVFRDGSTVETPAGREHKK